MKLTIFDVYDLKELKCEYCNSSSELYEDEEDFAVICLTCAKNVLVERPETEEDKIRERNTNM